MNNFLDKAGLTRLWQHILAKLGSKVDKVDGKSLSTNDFTNEYKNKLDNLEENISVKVDKVSGKGLSTNDFTDADKTKLNSSTSIQLISWEDSDF